VAKNPQSNGSGSRPAARRGAAKALDEAIGGLRPADLSGRVLPDARAELSVARRETEAAAMRILEAVEDILAGPGDDPAAFRRRVEARAEAILEACTFQDITGQRLVKVEAQLADLQARIERLLAASTIADADHVETDDDHRRKAQHLHGPGLAGPDVAQAAIDALFD